MLAVLTFWSGSGILYRERPGPFRHSSAPVIESDQLMLARQKDPSFHPLVKFWELDPNQLFLVVVAPEKKLAAEPAKYQALVRALVKASRFMYANKARTAEIAVKYAKIPRDVVEQAYDELVKGKVWRREDVEAWIDKHRPVLETAEE